MGNAISRVSAYGAHKTNLEILMIHDSKKVDDFSVHIQKQNTDAHRIKSRPISATDTLAKILEKQDVPLYVIWGEKDASVGVYLEDRMAILRKVNKNVRFHVEYNIGHWIMYENEKKFNDKFNTLFEKHMQTKIDPEKNSWFTQEDSLYENEEAHNMSQMNRAIDKVKSRQKEQQLTKYKGVNPLMHSGGNTFYEDDETEYVSSDIFSKLKYDDLRKVHKDETVFSVQDSDMKHVHQYGSVDEYQRARDTHDIQPMEQKKKKKWMDSQEQFLQENVRKKQYKQEMQTLYFSDKNKEVMSSFLRIT